MWPFFAPVVDTYEHCHCHYSTINPLSLDKKPAHLLVSYSLEERKSFGERCPLRSLVVDVVGDHPHQFLGPCGAGARERGHPNVVGTTLKVVVVLSHVLVPRREAPLLLAHLHKARLLALRCCSGEHLINYYLLSTPQVFPINSHL